MWCYDPYFPQLRIERSDGVVLEMYGSAPPSTTLAAGKMADNKLGTHLLYESVDLPVAKTWVMYDAQQAVPAEAIDYMKKTGGLVVKPLDGAHGHGVRVDIRSETKLKAAISAAAQYSATILIQAYVLNPTDIRLLCINFKFVAALERIPAHVTGDGKHTTAELIQLENNSDKRGENYTTDINIIPTETSNHYLGKTKHDVPAMGQIMQALGTANVGSGGITRDVTEELPQWMVALAEKAAKTSNLPCCGVDFLIKESPTNTAEYEDLDPVIIEVNKSPSLFIHERPIIGQSRPVTARLVDYITEL